jgi:hypothetical protein
MLLFTVANSLASAIILSGKHDNVFILNLFEYKADEISILSNSGSSGYWFLKNVVMLKEIYDFNLLISRLYILFLFLE